MNRVTFFLRLASLALMVGLNIVLDRYDEELEEVQHRYEEAISRAEPMPGPADPDEFEHVEQWDNDIDLSGEATEL